MWLLAYELPCLYQFAVVNMFDSIIPPKLHFFCSVGCEVLGLCLQLVSVTAPDGSLNRAI